MTIKYLKYAGIFLCLLAAGAILLWFLQNPLVVGRYSLGHRAALAEASALLLFSATALVLRIARRRLGVYLLAALLILVPPPVYFLYWLPRLASDGVEAEQLDSALITESTSNGIIEVGFAYPIYTPTLLISNRTVSTAEYDVYLRIYDANADSSLFRAVRGVLPNQSLSVEAAVNGMLSRSSGYLFNPVSVPPLGSVTGRLVFIISNLRDGTTFDDALNSAYPAEFELRDPASDELLLRFPLTRI